MPYRLLGASLAFALAGALPAAGATITLTYSGECSWNCDDEGLPDAAPASGWLQIDDSSFSPDGFMDESDLIDFSFDLGGIILDKASAAAFSFGGPWEVVPGAGLAWYLDASTSTDRFDLGRTISLSGNRADAQGMASFLGACDVSVDGSCAATFHTAAQFEMKASGTAPVPLPGAGLLLGGALTAAASLLRFRRASGRVRG